MIAKAKFTDGFIQYDKKTECLTVVGATAHNLFFEIRKAPLSPAQIVERIKEARSHADN